MGATRKELLREAADLRAKLTDLDAAIDTAEAAEEDATEPKSAFTSASKRLDVVLASIARKEAMLRKAEDDDDADDDKDDDSDKSDDDDKDDDSDKKSSRKRKSAPRLQIMRSRTKLQPLQRLGALLWAQGSAKCYGNAHAYSQVMKTWGDEELASIATGYVSKAPIGPIDTTEPTIVQDAVTDLITMLNAQSIVRASGARVVDMPMGNKTLFRQQQGAMAYFFGEGVQAPVSRPAFDVIQMTWHQLGALVYLTKQELQFPSINTGQVVIDEIVLRIALKEDNTFLLSVGAPGVPQGIIPQVAVSNIIPSTLGTGGIVDWVSVAADLASMESVLSGRNVQPPFVLYMHPNVVTFLKSLTNGFVFPFREELANGTLNGHRIFTTTQLPTNDGAGANESKIMIVKPSDLIIGDAYQYNVMMSTEGSLNDGGTQVNLFGEQKVAYLATSAIDFKMAHDTSAAILNAIGWTTPAGVMAGSDRYVQAPNKPPSFASSANPP